MLSSDVYMYVDDQKCFAKLNISVSKAVEMIRDI